MRKLNTQAHSHIQIKNLSYQYQKSSNLLVLDSINLDILKGDTIGIVGHIGSGKSTMIQILCGILSPSSGNVLFDNIAHEQLNWCQFRKDISYVSQDVFLFSDSIRNNILFGRENVSHSELIDIAKKLCFFNDLIIVVNAGK